LMRDKGADTEAMTRYIVYKNTRLYKGVYVDTFTTPEDAFTYADMHNRTIGDTATWYVVEEGAINQL
jgi:FPC/CPF motif-containing protein YcgG